MGVAPGMEPHIALMEGTVAISEPYLIGIFIKHPSNPCDLRQALYDARIYRVWDFLKVVASQESGQKEPHELERKVADAP